MKHFNRWLTIGTTLLVSSIAGCGNVDVDELGDDADAVASEVRISGRMLVTVPAAVVTRWNFTNDQSPDPGFQVNVEVHKTFSATRSFTTPAEPFEAYQVRTTGQESRTGTPRTLASTGSGAYRAVDGAFLIDGSLYLLGRATGGSRTVNGSVVPRNEKPVVMGLSFSGAAGRLNTATTITENPLDARRLVASSATVEIDTPTFAQRWTDADNEPFACYNMNNVSGQFLTGTSPTDFRSPEGAFVLNGNVYIAGEATGGATSLGGVNYRANAPRRALAAFGAATAGTAPNFSVSITTLPNAL
jgi:hypothetical protein